MAIKRIKSISVIGYCLSLLYLSSFLVYLTSMSFSSVRIHAATIAIIFLVLMISSIAVTQFKEWARKNLVILNAVLIVYFLFLWKVYPDFAWPNYILLNVIVLLFFSQKHIRIYYDPNFSVNRKSILIVDDDEGILRTVKKVLLPKGYSVLAASTGEKGFAIAKRQRPDLVILDVILPGIKGRDLCSKLKSDPETRDIPVIFLTAKDSPDDIEAEMAVGGESHLNKPVNSRELIATVKNILKE